MVKSQWEAQGSDKSWFSFRHNDAFCFVSRWQLLKDNWTVCSLKLIWGMPYMRAATLKTINGWRDIKHVSLRFISLRKRAHFSLPAVRTWFELAPPSPQRMSCNDANLGPFWQDLDTWYVGQLPAPCWPYQIHKYWVHRDGCKEKKQRQTDWVK